MSTALITQTKTFLEKQTVKLARWCRGGVQATALNMMALQELTNSAKARDATPQSVYIALLSCAISGLEPGSLKQEAFLIPFDRKTDDGWITEVKFLIGWRGLVKQALRAGGIHYLRSGVVHDGDVFEIDNGSANVLIHKPRIGTARGNVVGAYAIAKLVNGETQHEYVDIDELAKIQSFAEKKKPSPAWQQWPGEMMRKSAVRRLAKYLPMDETYFNGARLEQAREADSGPTEIEVLDQLTDGAASADLRDGGPISGFSAPRLESPREDVVPKPPRAAAPARETARPKPVSTPPSPTESALSSPTSASASSASTDSASTSVRTETSKSASSPTPDVDPCPDPEPAAHDSEDVDAASEIPSIHGFPSTLDGYQAWLRTCHTKVEVTEGLPAWREWARHVAKFDLGYKPDGPKDKTPARPPSPEMAHMSQLFNARYKELP